MWMIKGYDKAATSWFVEIEDAVSVPSMVGMMIEEGYIKFTVYEVDGESETDRDD